MTMASVDVRAASTGVGETLVAWETELDSLSYYDLLGIAPDAPPPDVQAAFHSFCEHFHPDAHRSRSEAERAILLKLFHRGVEAYRVLSNFQTRDHYDASLPRGILRQGSLPPYAPPTSYAPASYAPASGQNSAGPSGAPRKMRWEDLPTNASARPFARRAEELLNAGDKAQARLQLSLAVSKDPECSELRAILDELRK
jgi:DnaJ-class molecular chaperone